MRLSLRAKLAAIVAIPLLALVIVFITGRSIQVGVSAQLTAVQNQLIPKLELGPRLKADLNETRQAFQNAVSAQDEAALEATSRLSDQFLARLQGARALIEPGLHSQLVAAYKDYFATSYAVSRRLIANETGPSVVDAMARMQGKQRHTARLLEAGTVFDKDTIAIAFGKTAKALATATRIRAFTALACLPFTLVLVLWLSRGVLRSVRALNEGFARFGQGHFDQAIAIVSHDELGEAARQANSMAQNLKSLAEKAAALLEETQKQAQRLGEQEQALRRNNEDLKARQEELSHTNGVLATQAEKLEAQRVVLEREVEAHKATLVHLERSNGLLRHFSHAAAHDLRAPLRTIKGFMGCLLEESHDRLNDDEKSYIDRAVRANERLDSLLDALLVYVGLQNPKHWSELDLMSVVRHVQADLAERIAKANAVINVGNLPTIRGDASRIYQLFLNLIGNAIKFAAPERRPVVQVSSYKDVEGRTIFVVEDNGIGIAPEQAKAVFEPFTRLHSSSNYEGSGLGLAICRGIVEQHAGAIWVEPNPNGGARFSFTLALQDHLIDTKPSPASPVQTRGPLRLLLVEDSEEDELLLLRELKKHGFVPQCKRVETAEALAVSLREADWDVIVSDRSLPNFSGLGAIKVVKAAGSKVPIVLVSGTLGEPFVSEALKAGATDFISKQNLTPLIPVLDRILKRTPS